MFHELVPFSVPFLDQTQLTLEFCPMEAFALEEEVFSFFLVALVICVTSISSGARVLPPPNSHLQPSTVVHPQENIATHHFAQADRRIRIAVFTFNILNLGAAGCDATISNLFMTLLTQHQILEVMNRKGLEDSLRRAGIQQSEDDLCGADGRHPSGFGWNYLR